LKLDGSFNIVTNIERLTLESKSQEANVDISKFKRIEQFARFHHLSTPMVDLYFASL
jgi:hypothetical protein